MIPAHLPLQAKARIIVNGCEGLFPAKVSGLYALYTVQNLLATEIALKVFRLFAECDMGGTGLKAFFTTDQLSALDKVQNSLALGTSPVVRALVDPEGGMRSVRNLDSQSFSQWFKGHGGSQGSIDRMWNPVGELADQHCGMRLFLCPFLPHASSQGACLEEQGWLRQTCVIKASAASAAPLPVNQPMSWFNG